MYAASASMIGYQENSMEDLSLELSQYENMAFSPGIGYLRICQNLIDIRSMKIAMLCDENIVFPPGIGY